MTLQPGKEIQREDVRGRLQGGFSIKVRLRTSAEETPLTFGVTSGAGHEVNGYDALMALCDVRRAELFDDEIRNH